MPAKKSPLKAPKLCVYKINTSGIDLSKLPPGTCARFHPDEQDPTTFDPLSSKYLAPTAVDATGKPTYNGVYQVAGQPANNRSNHHNAGYRQYADVKYSYYEDTGPGSFPKWVWYALGAAAAFFGLALAKKGR